MFINYEFAFSVYELDHITTNTVCSVKQPQCKYTWDEWRTETAMQFNLFFFFRKKTFHYYMSVKVFWFSTLLAIINFIFMSDIVHIGCHSIASSNSTHVYWYRHLLHFIGIFVEIATFVVDKESEFWCWTNISRRWQITVFQNIDEFYGFSIEFYLILRTNFKSTSYNWRDPTSQ